MRMPWRTPYRWLWCTWRTNVWHIVTDIRDGICNVFRWAPVIWFDADFDWEYMAKIMEYKLRRMSKVLAEGHHLNRERDARQCLVCAELLHRLREDEYHENAQKFFEDDRIAARQAQIQSRNDKRYLGVLIGKYLNHWWD